MSDPHLHVKFLDHALPPRGSGDFSAGLPPDVSDKALGRYGAAKAREYAAAGLHDISLFHIRRLARFFSSGGAVLQTPPVLAIGAVDSGRMQTEINDLEIAFQRAPWQKKLIGEFGGQIIISRLLEDAAPDLARQPCHHDPSLTNAAAAGLFDPATKRIFLPQFSRRGDALVSCGPITTRYWHEGAHFADDATDATRTQKFQDARAANVAALPPGRRVGAAFEYILKKEDGGVHETQIAADREMLACLMEESFGRHRLLARALPAVDSLNKNLVRALRQEMAQWPNPQRLLALLPKPGGAGPQVQ